jgi:PilZ domain
MDDYNQSDREDRRNATRRPTRIRAWADPGGTTAPADCVIVDLSEEGAMVSATGERPLPENFELLNDANSKLGDAKVMWRSGDSVGVRFEKRNAQAVHAVGAQPDAAPTRGASGPRSKD